jgi:hypothetical protein
MTATVAEPRVLSLSTPDLEAVDARQRARDYTRAHGEDPPEIRDW